MHTVTKRYRDLPAAHRQPNHKGHCHLLHGHSFGFDIVFVSTTLNDCGFVIDLGELKDLKKWMDFTFDHTIVLNHDDPLIEQIAELPSKVIPVPNCGMEGLAKYVYEYVVDLLENDFLEQMKNRGLMVLSVTCHEDSKNSATYIVQ